MGIEITSLRPEIQTLVNSDPKKYDPNANGQIDDGVELSQLLSEYQCKAEVLTDFDKKEPMWALAEKTEIRNKAEDKSKGDKTISRIVAGILTFGSLMGTLNVMAESKSLKKAGWIGGAITAAIFLGGMFGVPAYFQKNAEKNAKLDIKAEQSAKGAATMQERLKHEQEMREREVALKQRDAEYQERIQTATTEIDNKLKTADRRAKNINKNLKEAEAKTEVKEPVVAE